MEVAREAEKKLKRLKMAKYSTELFDEIVKEMMNEKKTIMEMMAELDVEDDAIFKAQTRLAKFIQAKNKVNWLKTDVNLFILFNFINEI